MENDKHGSCSLRYLSSITSISERNAKILEYCRVLAYKNNPVTFYYLNMKERALFTVFIAVLILLIIFFLTKKIVELFLTKFILSIKKRHNLSSVVVGIFILPFWYGFSSFFSLHYFAKSEPFHLYYEVCKLISATFHLLALPFTFALLTKVQTQDIPKTFLNISFLFITLSFVAILFLGYIEEFNYYYCQIFLVLGLIYYSIIILWIPSYNKKKLEDEKKWDKIDAFTQEINEEDQKIDEVLFYDVLNLKDLKKKQLKIEKQQKTVMYRIWKQIWDSDLDLSDNLIQSPIIIASLFTIPYPKNPMMKTIIRYPIVFLGSFLGFNGMISSLGLLYSLLCAILILTIYILMETFLENKNYVKTFVEIISIFQAQYFLNYLSLFTGDALYFFPFAFSLNRTTYATICDAIRNNVWRLLYTYVFFMNGEYAMAIMSNFSLIIAFMTINMSKVAAINYYYQNDFFSLFGDGDPFLNSIFEMSDNTQNLIIFVIFFSLILIATQAYYFNGMKINNPIGFGRSMLVIWSTYMVIITAHGILFVG